MMRKVAITRAKSHTGKRLVGDDHSQGSWVCQPLFVWRPDRCGFSLLRSSRCSPERAFPSKEAA